MFSDAILDYESQLRPSAKKYELCPIYVAAVVWIVRNNTWCDKQLLGDNPNTTFNIGGRKRIHQKEEVASQSFIIIELILLK